MPKHPVSNSFEVNVVSISKNGTSNISFQLILDSNSILLSTAPDGKIRANINQLDEQQLRKIVEGIADAGPEVLEKFLELVTELTVSSKTINSVNGSAEDASETHSSGANENQKLLEI